MYFSCGINTIISSSLSHPCPSPFSYLFNNLPFLSPLPYPLSIRTHSIVCWLSGQNGFNCQPMALFVNVKSVVSNVVFTAKLYGGEFKVDNPCEKGVNFISGMDPPPSIENVMQATNALYHDPDVSRKEAASKWLQEFQQSVCIASNRALYPPLFSKYPHMKHMLG